MSEINLLPEELKPSGYISKLDNAIKKISIFLLALLILICFLGGSAYGFLFYQNDLLNNENQKLKSEILALESVEQRLVFLKDRISKVSKVNALTDISESKVKLEQILEQISDKANLNKLELKSNEIHLEITFDNTLDSENFVKYLKESGDYIKIELENYNVTNLGYRVVYYLVMK
ncbi:MAG: hypothetical protein NZM26_03995 [Patescibacteria group bacterium]|nr:hypothetical protein [Patescibacteria group bacterium]